MATAKPTIQALSAFEELRGVSRGKLNANDVALQTAINGVIDDLAALTATVTTLAASVAGIGSSANSFYVRKWTGSAYPARPSTTTVPAGLGVAIGPQAPTDAVFPDTWIDSSQGS